MSDEIKPMSIHALTGTLPDYTPRIQLNEIKGLLAELRTWSEKLNKKIEAVRKEGGDPNCLHNQQVYREAAISMAAVGAIAPFIEGLLVHGFENLRAADPAVVGGRTHHRWQAGSRNTWNPDYWFCPETNKPEKGIARGTIQLMEALEIRDRFPEGLNRILDALFKYRNTMFHNGTEWPVSKRGKFRKTVKDKEWKSWFYFQEYGMDTPWLCYMTQEAIEKCLETAEALLEQFLRILDEWKEESWNKHDD